MISYCFKSCNSRNWDPVTIAVDIPQTPTPNSAPKEASNVPTAVIDTDYPYGAVHKSTKERYGIRFDGSPPQKMSIVVGLVHLCATVAILLLVAILLNNSSVQPEGLADTIAVVILGVGSCLFGIPIILRTAWRALGIVTLDWARTAAHLAKRELMLAQQQWHYKDYATRGTCPKSFCLRFAKHCGIQLAKNIAKMVFQPFASIAAVFAMLYAQIVNVNDGRRALGKIELLMTRDLLMVPGAWNFRPFKARLPNELNIVLFNISEILAPCMLSENNYNRYFRANMDSDEVTAEINRITSHLYFYEEFYTRENKNAQALIKLMNDRWDPWRNMVRDTRQQRNKAEEAQQVVPQNVIDAEALIDQAKVAVIAEFQAIWAQISAVTGPSGFGKPIDVQEHLKTIDRIIDFYEPKIRHLVPSPSNPA